MTEDRLEEIKKNLAAIKYWADDCLDEDIVDDFNWLIAEVERMRPYEKMVATL